MAGTPVNHKEYSQMTRDERNTLALALLEQFTPLVQKYTTAYGLNFEEARQDASISIIEVLDAGIERIDNLPAYIMLRLKSRLINKFVYIKRHQATSLDAVLTPDDQEGPTLADLLPSPYQVDPAIILLARERIQEALLYATSLHHGTARLARELGASALASMEV
jgi:hypothetical protein